ncbi:3-isopropylmalate dehydratase small subunit [Geothrix limicola]|uniref:3-isopropylmalate dehydratase small subunit n=1 Tax=Geothrix limicola TaxID=2927978 RepID=A0ABQ5QB96_9BACT|nr:3-isopropylmalate dehydratase small subunit [Geothrix limicola]GLH71948.1 3-isopropylmalate dehydratase small subunit [Geothrix limicola]
MDPFTVLTGTAAPLLRANIDTDLIIPKQFLKTLVRSGLGRNLFHEIRYDSDGRERPDFVLNQAPYRKASILLAGPNFGCGSSREHAPWALKDFGIRAILAPSFADIFFNNCFSNGLLPVTLPGEAIESLAACEGPLTIDLPAQQVRGGGQTFTFEIEAARKAVLLEGLDEIKRTEANLADITAYEARRRQEAPWLDIQKV